MSIPDTEPYNVWEVRELGHITLPTRWGNKLVSLTDDSAYDVGGYIVLVWEGNEYYLPGFIKAGRFHDDASYTQLLPLELTYKATR